MGTSFTTPKNSLRYPTGAVGEAPDPADDLHKLASDIDDALGAWVSYSPSFANAAGLTASGEYIRTAKTVHFKGVATFIAGAAVGGQIRMSLPIGMRANSQPVGTCFGADTGTGYYDLLPMNIDGGSIAFFCRIPSTSMLQSTGPNAPFGWGTTDVIQWDLWYGID